jgi:hypothetical protein
MKKDGNGISRDGERLVRNEENITRLKRDRGFTEKGRSSNHETAAGKMKTGQRNLNGTAKNSEKGTNEAHLLSNTRMLHAFDGLFANSS